MIWDNSDFAALRSGTLLIDCPRMELVPLVDGSSTNYHGAGYISVGEQGIDFKLFTSQTYTVDEVFNGSSSKAGELLSDGDYFWLYALDIRGREWRSGRVYPNIKRASGIVITGRLHEIQAIEPHRLSVTKAAIKLWYPEAFKLPPNLRTHSITKVGETITAESWSSNAATFESSTYEFTFVPIEHGWSSIEVSKVAEGLPEYLAGRVEESLEFVLGKSARALIIEEVNATDLRVSLKSRGKYPSGYGRPPLIAARDQHGATWRLFDCFFRYAQGYQEPFRSPLSRILQYIFQLNETAIDARALALGVAVEGILKASYSHLSKPSDQFLADLDSARKLLRTSDLSTSGVISRIEGALDAMKETRAKDQLKALVGMNVISQHQLGSWSKLRNSTAHAEVHDLDNKFLSLCDKVLVLAYCLILNVIGYKGPFTDYGIPDYPEREYPLSPSMEVGA